MKQFRSRNYYVLYTAILVCCIIMFSFLLSGKYVWLDEAYSFAKAKHSFAELWEKTSADGLFYIYLKFMTMPFGYSLISAKIATLIPFIYIVAFGGIQLKQLINERTSLLFMVLFPIFPFSMQFAFEIRTYSLAMAILYSTAIFAYRCYKNNKISDWILLSIFGALSVYCHYYTALDAGLLFLLLLYFGIRNRKVNIKKWCLFVVVTVILCIHWLKIFLTFKTFNASSTQWIPEISFSTIFDYLYTLFGCPGIDYVSPVLSVLTAVSFLAAFISIIKCDKKDIRQLAFVCLLVSVFTIAFGIAASIIYRPIFIIRYCVPTVPLLITFLVICLDQSDSKILFWFIVSTAVLSGIVNYIVMLRNENETIENSIDSSFVDECGDIDCYVVFETYDVTAVLNYYVDNVPVYTYDDYIDSKQIWPNQFGFSDFDSSDNDSFVLILDIGEIIPSEFDDYSSVFLGEYDSAGNPVDAYLLTR